MNNIYLKRKSSPKRVWITYFFRLGINRVTKICFLSILFWEVCEHTLQPHLKRDGIQVKATRQHNINKIKTYVKRYRK